MSPAGPLLLSGGLPVTGLWLEKGGVGQRRGFFLELLIFRETAMRGCVSRPWRRRSAQQHGPHIARRSPAPGGGPTGGNRQTEHMVGQRQKAGRRRRSAGGGGGGVCGVATTEHHLNAAATRVRDMQLELSGSRGHRRHVQRPHRHEQNGRCCGRLRRHVQRRYQRVRDGRAVGGC